jgi:aminoglycoside phosphotransferase (APT) family kinase protein
MTHEVHDGGNRPHWQELPAEVRIRIETLLGGRVASVVPALGGFSPGFASTLSLENGSQFFVKAMSDLLTPAGADTYRREGAVLRQLPPLVRNARLVSIDDDGDWIVLVYDVIDGRSPVPSRPAELRLMLDTFTEFARILTPTPFAAPAFEEKVGWPFDSWQRADLRVQIAGGPEFEWARDHAVEIREFAKNWRWVARGETLLHGDLRADNMILTAEGIVVVDWPDVCIGAPWLDLVMALPSFGMFPDPPSLETILQTHPLTAEVDPEAIDRVIAALAGFFGWASLEPAPIGLPSLRAFQREQASQAFRLLRDRWRY